MEEKIRPTDEDIEEAKELIRNTIIRIDDCWEHDIDGSFIRVNHSHLFSIMFNEVISGHKPTTRKSEYDSEWETRTPNPTGLMKAFKLLGGEYKETQYPNWIK